MNTGTRRDRFDDRRAQVDRRNSARTRIAGTCDDPGPGAFGRLLLQLAATVLAHREPSQRRRDPSAEGGGLPEAEAVGEHEEERNATTGRR